MGFIEGLIIWSNDFFGPWGIVGLAAVSFMESSFFPVPPDLLLIPLVIAAPELALVYALIATLSSVAGAVLGYFIGVKGGRPVLLKLAGERKTKKVEHYFKKYGNWAIGIAGFTPIPYKIFTIAAGVFEHGIKDMLVISFISRGARFFLEAIILMIWGKEIVAFIEEFFGIVTFIAVAGLIALYFVYKRYFSRRQIDTELSTLTKEQIDS